MNQPHSRAVIVVSGLPRSGTSMMMKMLEAGGLPVLTDGERSADADNPKGYYEFERVKQLPKGDHTWVADAQGCAVKIISALLPHLPADQHYRVLFMRRQMAEILASQQKMLVRRGEGNSADDGRMAQLFEKHLATVQAWLAAQPHIATLEVDYNAMLAAPHPLVAAIDRFLGGSLKQAPMLASIEPTLYRNREM